MSYDSGHLSVMKKQFWVHIMCCSAIVYNMNIQVIHLDYFLDCAGWYMVYGLYMVGTYSIKLEIRLSKNGQSSCGVILKFYYYLFYIKYKIKTNPDEIALDEQLWHRNRVTAETFSDFLLHFPAHEYVSLHELDQVSPQDLSDLQAPLVRVPDYAHSGRVQYNFAGFFFLPRLKHTVGSNEISPK